MKFDCISVNEGLSHSTVLSIAQDNEGCLWIGTMHGLNRYDGQDFTVYHHRPGDASSISGDFIKSIYVDSFGDTWIGTMDKGLNRHITRTDTFESFRFDPGNKSSISSDKITTMAEDGERNLWIGTTDGGLNKFDRRNKVFKRYLPGDPGAGGPADTRIQTMVYDKIDDVLWLGTTANGLLKFNHKSGGLTIYKHEKNTPGSLSENYVRSLFFDSSGTLWAGTYNKGVNRFNREDGTFTMIVFSLKDSPPIVDETIYSIHEDSEGFIWCGTEENGLIRYDKKTNECLKFTHDKSEPGSLSSKTVMSIFKDRSGIVWVGTDRGGMCKYDVKKKNFSLISNERNKDFNVNGGFINALIRDKRGHIWAGFDNGLERIDLSSGAVTPVFRDTGKPGLADAVFVRVLYEDADGDIWIGTKSHGLFRYDETGEKFVRFNIKPAEADALKSTDIKSILRDKQGVLWVGTIRNGLYRYESEAKDFIPFNKAYPGKAPKNVVYINTLYEDMDDNLWIGTYGAGLIKFNNKSGAVTHFKNDPEDNDSVSSDYILDIAEDKAGNVWFGVLKGGLNLFEKSTGQFRRYTDDGNITEEEIHNILEDDAGNLWLGAGKRIIRFDVRTRDFKYFYTDYWLDNNEIISRAAFKDNRGRMFFGGVKGISSFDPTTVSRVFNEPGSLIVSVRINNKVTGGETIRLPYNHQSIDFSCKMIDFRLPRKSRFKYMLENYGGGWGYSANLSSLYYDKLSPGEYTFRVRGANHLGVWNEATRSVKIVVAPPFWGALWFKLLVAVLILAAIFLLDKLRTYKMLAHKAELEKVVEERTVDLRKKQEELEKARETLEIKVKERTKELLKQNTKLNFEINERIQAEEESSSLREQLFHAQKMESVGRLAGGIAHDFNNILAGIMGYAELLKMKFPDTSTAEGKATDIILQGAGRAATLTRQLLGFARRGKYNPVPLSVNEVLKDTVFVSEKMFEKNIAVEFFLDENLRPVEADRNQLDQVFTNLFINAKDAMPQGGKLTITTKTHYIDDQSVALYPGAEPGYYNKISITDTGMGMPEDVKNNIFEPFFTTKEEGKGTGLGLATVYGIIKHHNGHISCYSELGLGTTFNISLPVSDKDIVKKMEAPELITGSATILVVDDEYPIRSIYTDMLNKLGYKVITVPDGHQAIDIYGHKMDEIDCVLLDMIMPGLTGEETFYELKKIDGNIKVILSSGYSQEEKAAGALSEGVKGFIQKPFSLHELSQIVADALKE